MSNDFQAGVSQELINNASVQVFPTIQSKLTETIKILDGAETMTWSVTKALVFDFSKSDSKMFFVDVALSVMITASQKAGAPEAIAAIGQCNVAISPHGDVTFSMTDMSFTTSDRGLKGILDANKQSIIAKLDSLLQSFKIPLGPIEGTTLNGFASEVTNNVFYASGGISGGATVSPNLTNNGKFKISLSNQLIQNIVHDEWWAKTSKIFRPTQDVTINLNSYSFQVQGSRFVLVLNVSGEIDVDVLFGTARWGIKISPVTIDLNVSIDGSNNVVLKGGNVSKPHIDFPEPLNAGAAVLDVLAYIVSFGQLESIINSLFDEQIANAIRSQLKGTVYTVPKINGLFDGVSYTVSPKNLQLAVGRSRVDIEGLADLAISG